VYLLFWDSFRREGGGLFKLHFLIRRDSFVARVSFCVGVRTLKWGKALTYEEVGMSFGCLDAYLHPGVVWRGKCTYAIWGSLFPSCQPSSRGCCVDVPLCLFVFLFR